MSDHALRLVPQELQFQPELAAALSAEALLRAIFPEAQQVQSKYFESVSFIDAGENWEGVRCSACGADAESWWSDSMSAAAEVGFSSLITKAPCCGTTVQLSELNYGWPVAFGRFALEVLNPNASSLTHEQLTQLSALLGAQVVMVHARI